MSSLFFFEYNSLLIYLIVSLLIAFYLVIISYLFASQIGGTEKLSTYELSSVLSSEEFNESKLETNARLSDYDLVIKNVEIEVLSIVFLIYKQ